ncbi:AraC family transcriptional regulator [Paenibacillus sp. HB172176]|uniref:AraC family transcriptional regulator n=1 Tax=Paenibacillus sp. HB172176 TaxID=2493690 RepID=UPI00197E506B|nr:AraC family transcriptional regulator [Paenibacillus sp. HB172176]
MKARSEIGRRGVFYRKSFIWLLLTAAIPGMITGLCLYWFGVGHMEDDLSELHQSQMKERVQNIDDQLSYLEMDLSHWAFSPRFGYSLKDMDFVYQFQEARDISKSLLVMQGSHPLIQDVELYINREEPVVFKTEHYRVYDPAMLTHYQQLLQDKRSVYWLEHLDEAEAQEDSVEDVVISTAETPLTLVHKVPGDSSQPFGALVVTLNREKLVNLLKTMTPYNEGLTFLLNAGGETILSDDPAASELVDELKSRLAGSSAEEGAFRLGRGGVMYSVSYGKLSRLDKEWTYVSASPMNAITSPVLALSKLIVAISLASLVIGLILSWLASRRMYDPMERLLRKLNPGSLAGHKRMDEFQYIEALWQDTAAESSELQAKLSDQQPMLRNGFLLQLLYGHLLSYSERELRERMARYGWQTGGHRFGFMHIRLTGLDGHAGEVTENDESLFTFAASNIAEELAEERFEQFHVMNFHNLALGLFVILPDRGQAIEGSNMPRMRELAEDITSAINKLLKLQAAITISKPLDEVKRLTATFMELERASSFRQFVNQNQILMLDALDERELLPEVQYPFQTELEIIQAMRCGDASSIDRLLHAFMDELLAGDGLEVHVQQGMLQLLASLQHMMLEAGVNPSKLFGCMNAFEELSRIRDSDKLLRWMKNYIIAPYLLERETRAGVQQKQVIDRTIVYIHEHYGNDISLESCGDHVGMSSYALSKLFKSVTGVNFIDYLTELRIGNAKELLLTTNLRINDVAEQVGYQQRYFNRIFKKLVGTTPSEYREAGGAAK